MGYLMTITGVGLLFYIALEYRREWQARRAAREARAKRALELGFWPVNF